MTTQTRAPTSDIAVTGTAWSGTPGSRFTLVDDYPDATGTDSLTCGTASAGSIIFGFPVLSVPAGAVVSSVVVRYYDQKSGGAGSLMAGRIRVGSITFDAATHNPANAVWTQRADTWATNPATGAAWTADQVNGTAGSNNLTAFGVVVNDANPAVLLSSIQVEVNYTAGAAGTFASTLDGVTMAASGTLSIPGQMAFGKYRIAALRHGSSDRNANTAATRTALAAFDWVFWGASSTTNLESNIADIRAQAGKPQLHSNYTIAQQVGGQISAIGSITRSGTTVTVNTQSDTGVAAAPNSTITLGSTVTIINSPIAAYNANWTVASVGATSFTFTASGAASTAANDTSGEAIACATNTTVNHVIVKLGAQKDWWLWKVGTSGRRYSGITGFNAFEINGTTYASADANGDRFPQWRAKDYRSTFFGLVDGFDYVYIDNYLDTRPDKINDVQFPGQQSFADFKQTGTAQNITDADVVSAVRSGHAAFADQHRASSIGQAKSANLKVIGNHDAALPGEYAGTLEAVFLEGVVGRSWSEDLTSFAAALAYYGGVRGKLREPQAVVFNALLTSADQGKDSSTHDYSRATYAYCMAALQGTLDDTYIQIKADDDNDGTHLYDEYAARLGRPIEGNQTSAWSGTAYRRLFENGCVIVNSSHTASVTVTPGAGYTRITGADRPTWNTGQPVSGSITIGPWDGIVLLKSTTPGLLQDVTMAASGAVGATSGTFASTLAGATMSAAGLVAAGPAGFRSLSLMEIGGIGATPLIITGSFASTLAGATMVASGVSAGGPGSFRSMFLLEAGGAGATTAANGGFRSFVWLEGGGAYAAAGVPTGTISVTLGGVTMAASGLVSIIGSVQPTLAGATMAASGFVGNSIGGFRSFAWMEGGGAAQTPAQLPMVFPLDEGLPVAWLVDPGFAAIYAHEQLGLPSEVRDQVGGPVDGQLDSQLDGVLSALSGDVAQDITGTAASTLDGCTMAAIIAVGAPTGAIASTLDGIIGADLRGQIVVPGLFASTLDDATMSASGAATQYASGTFSSTLDDVFAQAGGFVGDPSAARTEWRWIGVSNITLGL